MKIGILNIHYILSDVELKAIASNTLNTGDVKCINFLQYVFYPQATEGIKPNDIIAEAKGRWVKKHNPKKYYFIVTDAYDFPTNNSTDVSSISMWNKAGKSLQVDHGYIAEEIMQIAKATTWALLTNSDKDLVGYYYAVDAINPTYGDTEIITHYVVTKGMTGNEAGVYHTKLVSENLNQLVSMAHKRANDATLKAAFIMYFKDITTVNNYVNATTAYTVSYKNQYLLGIGRGDTKAGYMDFVENTGGYSAGGGIKDYEMNPAIVTAYLPFVSPVDINNPTQVELDAAEDLVRNTLVGKIVDKLVYGKAI